jgi:8-oxo-dGTP pyrophosphatase MutT (NUDIX family)
MREINREIVGALICSRDGKVLLGKAQGRAVFSGSWCVIGGGIEKNEDMAHALLREVKEETGLDISECIVEPLGITGQGKSEKTLKNTGERVIVEMTFNDFKIEIDKDSENIIFDFEKEEFENMQWFGREELRELDLSPFTKKLLERQHLL